MSFARGFKWLVDLWILGPPHPRKHSQRPEGPAQDIRCLRQRRSCSIPGGDWIGGRIIFQNYAIVACLPHLPSEVITSFHPTIQIVLISSLAGHGIFLPGNKMVLHTKLKICMCAYFTASSANLKIVDHFIRHVL